MFTSRNTRRFRAIVIALAITFGMNYAISYAAKADGPTSDLKYQVQRSGNTTTTPKPPVLPRE
jgi:hypothetical protein